MKKYKEIETYLKKSIAQNIAPDFDPCLDNDNDVFLNIVKTRIDLLEGYTRTSETTLRVMKKMLLLYLLNHLDEIYSAKQDEEKSYGNVDANFPKIRNKNLEYFELTNVIKLYAIELGKSPLPKDLVFEFLMELIENYPTKASKSEYKHDAFDMYEKGSLFFWNDDILEFVTGSPEIYSNLPTVLLRTAVVGSYIDATLCLNKIKDNINQIRNSYLHNQKGLDEVSINDICLSLENLGFPSNLVTYMRKYLKKQLIGNTGSKKVTEEKPSKYISDKEYRNLLKEVKKYYNPYTRKLTNEFISSEDRERIAAIMIRLGLEQYQVIDFLKKTETVNKTYTYEYFKDHVDEFEYYFGESLSQVHEYMKEIESCTDEEDKEYWIMGINEELAKLNNSHKLGSYEYETKLLERK